ncbi:Oxidoreductase NAD-binding domain-containing protein 1 [Madurella mycetomatis]|uniref:Oxidoreductase NAD-binding domain-containing protein 1 n=1 Tax=Madurella mycetomatis TaxID=100816 RepID=A0A175VY64_9PEZI|nr:Oxidoreductase NAD-binding domain-containing protein 1 [Madurella mycetomatis]
MSKESHIERTAHEPRDACLHTLTISHITQVTPTIRLFRLEISSSDGIQFLPGQWVDLYPPPSAGVLKPGGFTITSAPSLAVPSPSHTSTPYIELAIQSSPSNPPAAYLFQPPSTLLHTPVQVRIGGSFVFPPPSFRKHPITTGPNAPPAAGVTPLRKVVLVASGMGVNPLMSMLSHIGEPPKQDQDPRDFEVRLLYSVKSPFHDGGGGTVLFLDRIAKIFQSGGGRVRGGVQLFLTGGDNGHQVDKEARARDMVRCGGAGEIEVPFLRRRMMVTDVEEAIGQEDKEAVAVYICGVPAMTDEFVGSLVSAERFGMEKERVLFEKWW